MSPSVQQTREADVEIAEASRVHRNGSRKSPTATVMSLDHGQQGCTDEAFEQPRRPRQLSRTHQALSGLPAAVTGMLRCRQHPENSATAMACHQSGLGANRKLAADHPQPTNVEISPTTLADTYRTEGKQHDATDARVALTTDSRQSPARTGVDSPSEAAPSWPTCSASSPPAWDRAHQSRQICLCRSDLDNLHPVSEEFTPMPLFPSQCGPTHLELRDSGGRHRAQ